MIHNWYNINGGIGSGKTSLLKQLVARAYNKNIPVFGFYQPLLKVNGVRQGYDIVVLGNGIEKTFPFVRPRETVREDGMIWKFDENALLNTEKFFDSLVIPKKKSIIIFDEYGRLESKGKGQWNNYKKLLSKFTDIGVRTSSVITSRDQTIDLLRNSMKNIGFGNEKMQLNLPSTNIDKFMSTVLE